MTEQKKLKQSKVELKINKFNLTRSTVAEAEEEGTKLPRMERTKKSEARTWKGFPLNESEVNWKQSERLRLGGSAPTFQNNIFERP